MKKEYIYIGQYFHYYGKDLQDLGLTEKKIGKTINLKQREYQLNRTKGTIGYTYVAAWDVKDMDSVEKALHIILDANRMSGEWFEDPNNDLVQRVRDVMSLLSLGKEVDLGNDKDEEINKVRAESKPFIVDYKGAIFQGKNAVDTLKQVCSQILEDDVLTEDQLIASYLFTKSPVLNHANGKDYTSDIGKDWRVYTSLGNKDKVRHLESLNLDILIKH